MDKQNARDIAHEWDDLLNDAFGSTEIAIDTDAAPVKEEAAMVTPVPEEPTVTAPAPETPAKRPLYRRFWFWLVLIALAALLGVTAWLSSEKDKAPEPTTPWDAQEQAALNQCKTALAQWQAMETYHMTQSNLYYGSGQSGMPEGEIWVSGDNMMQIYHFESMNYIFGSLKHNGTMYAAGSYILSSTGIPEMNYWYLADENDLAETALPWPMLFDFDTSEIVNITASGRAIGHSDQPHFTSVSFAVLRSDSEDESMYPCHVNFTFDVYGNLKTVTVVHVNPGEELRASIFVATYRLESTDYDIAQYIAEAKDLPLTFVLSNSLVSLLD